MFQNFKVKPASIALFGAFIIVAATTLIATTFSFLGFFEKAALSLLFGTHLLVLIALWFAYRSSTRVQTVTRSIEKESVSAKILEDKIYKLTTEVQALREEEKVWHDLTRKRIRQKHDSLVLISRKHRDLHELTRKRIREKNNSLHKLVGQKVENLARLQRQIAAQSAKSAQQNKQEQKVASGPIRDRSSIRNALFTIMEQNGK